ncbi:AbrB/MazE/SpoVT family DNA-binding domain-containing protein [Riemerella columbina]|uniref:AbrB/MazE/SpoVT family DNA-binding domain-containing protein n=1 Tax=Riemerella columbina TaxID=103810 RepID=UPI00266F7EBE|nr:hypothetical protein [Riemerella columbina]WKS94423.1 hypothetical protein NYR17_05615 [Riemerella columbina]
MITKVRKIGNSYGIILGKKLLEQAKMENEVILSLSDNKIIIEAVNKNPRKGWEEMLLKAGSLEDQEQPYVDFNNQFDEEEWTW